MRIPLYQPVGSSSHQLAAQLGARTGEPTTHTGTLDPMAEGVLLCLTGDDRLRKIEYATYQKTYRFTILVGYSTDSHDLLGIVTANSTQTTLHQIPETILEEFRGVYDQTVPDFSARRVAGKSSFDLAKAHQPLQPKTQPVTIYSLTQQKHEEVTQDWLRSHIEQKITKVAGDFRQEECIATWHKVLLQSKASTQKYSLLTFDATTSKRTYIRGLVRDISQRIGIPLTTFHIIRTANGPYHIQDCLCLV